jgi:hydrogenase maturation protein HypF
MIKEITIKGAVQGVGYRPFIAAKAKEFNISGHVQNLGAEVRILAIGRDSDTEAFLSCIKKEMPRGAFIVDIIVQDVSDLPEYKETAVKITDFTIDDSSLLDLSTDIPVFLPDIGICDDCLEEMLDPKDRRYRYPLISCAVCGPRLSILDQLPYDRIRTTMKSYEMCPSCQKEYTTGRRRYAQTISCHSCGPQMILRTCSNDGTYSEVQGDEAVSHAAKILSKGGIIGLKGVSGYQLICRCESKPANRLRLVKGRENKPFAIMFSDISSIKKFAQVSPLEEKLLTSSARPIVLLKKIHSFDESIVKGSAYIGAFLPSAGIHRLLTDALGPLIVSSANRSDQPIITEDEDFFSTFFGAETDSDKVDAVLYHGRKINMPQDDSVMFVISGSDGEQAQFIRRSRGFAPLPVFLDRSAIDHLSERVVFSYGGDLKSAFSIAHNDRIMPSQYIGDLKDLSCLENYKALKKKYHELFKQRPDLYVCDMHPSYLSVQMAQKDALEEGIELLQLQHHAAHIYSVMAEYSLTECIGVAFDGTGYGTDGCIWGSEFFVIEGSSYKRAASLSYITLIGGDTSSKDADKLKQCYEYAAVKRKLLKQHSPIDRLISSALDNNIQTFSCSSFGRLFDAVSSLLEVCSYNSYEGECPILLEKAASEYIESGFQEELPELSFIVTDDDQGIFIDQLKMYADISNCFHSGLFSKNAIAYSFHKAVIEVIITVCSILRSKCGQNKVALSGGVFNNRILLSGASKALIEAGFTVYHNHLLPLGDGCISTGQGYYGLISK